MRLIQIDQYHEKSMELAKPVYDSQGRVLLAAGNRIHPKYLTKLKAIGVTFLLVEDVMSSGITLDEMVDMPTWMDASQTVKDCYEHAKARKLLPVRELQQTAAKLLNEVKRRKAVLLIPSTSVAKELQPFAHSVNVALIALQIGKILKYTDSKQRDLVIGCLLHDIGKAVTNKEQEHPEKGFEILRTAREINLLSAHIAYQHHEKVNGEGFPRKLKGSEFIEFAQVCSIANEFENMISKQEISTYEAIERLMTTIDKSYSHQVIDALFKGVPSYLPGTLVRLSTGEAAIVMRIENHLHRPVVKIAETEKEISLEDNPTIVITEELTEAQIKG
ncbi:HD-GYP domain-containing protein [Bacillus alkalicellulosilyticus]|uniref:HD-GYP domain-containing protein n=1 Tax=Alkalihalobacterium alkalicellulosilyticum TaxID=1912214 RepID=UPI000998D8BC|nr:HD domain-containing protein [Bacillus alkalicellulosilyticus]